jgi:hypothetical protein
MVSQRYLFLPYSAFAGVGAFLIWEILPGAWVIRRADEDALAFAFGVSALDILDPCQTLSCTKNRSGVRPHYFGNANAPASTFGLRLKLQISVTRADSKTLRRFSGSEVSASIQPLPATPGVPRHEARWQRR